MTDQEVSRIEDLWWAGIRLWYNEQDLLAAMQVWKETIDSVAWNDDDDDHHKTPNRGKSKHYLQDKLESTIIPPPNEPYRTGGASLLAPLLLFLAGCSLDAGDTVAARRLCRRCVSTEHFRKALLGGAPEGDDFAHCVLSEYIATLQEDEGISEPWTMATRLAEWAIRERQTASSSPESIRSILLWTDPYQRPGFLYPSLSSKAVYPRQDHPDWCQALEEQYPTIRHEYQLLMRGNNDNNNATMPRHWPRVGAGDHRDGAGQHDASVVQAGGDWREIVLFGSGARPDLAPKTCRILQRCAPEAVDLAHQGAGEIIFSVLAPQTHIAPHCASTNLRLTAHLGLQVPPDEDDCYLQVANETLHWKEGQILVFDDSFQHEVHNPSNDIRAVLLMRFWHPNLSPRDRATALQHVLTAKETDRLRRCNPPLPPPATTSQNNRRVAVPTRRHPQGMNQRMCPTCGRSGFETIRLLDPEDCLFGCVCGRESPL